ncbi:MAG: serine acetyltransferase [Planctomycetota bacterium]|jgi:serine O-acetyltransferase|nr:serine acetyltransferase [Planctomycetota bacterium]
MGESNRGEIDRLVEILVDSCADNLAVNHVEGHDLPDKHSVELVLDMLLAMLFPGYNDGKALSPAGLPYHFGDLAVRIMGELPGLAERALAYDCRLRSLDHAACDSCDRARKASLDLLRSLPDLRELAKGDMQAAYERDPAAESRELILFCYPGLEAVATYRLAHVLHRQGVPIIPRMWAERAHSRTGIDIHPGASIGKRFFIDHGTGVVVGETTNIGDDVSLYQGVTLGALSPAAGQTLRQVKRHPTIEDGVIIYAGATILGGETVIGRNSVIGGSVWLTESVPPGTRVTLSRPNLVFSHHSERSAAAGRSETGESA